MAEGTIAEPAYVAQLSAALQQRLPGAQITHERIRGDRYRFIIVWDQFDDMGHPERQRIVWDTADAALAKSDLLNVGMIITIGPAELPNAD